jgi:hypothetical protein
MTGQLISQISIPTNVMIKIVPLKDAMMLDHPEIRIAYKGLENCRGNVRMIECSKRVSNVVQQCADDVFFISPVSPRASSCLKAMRISVHWISAIVTLQQLEVCDNSVRECLCKH